MRSTLIHAATLLGVVGLAGAVGLATAAQQPDTQPNTATAAQPDAAAAYRDMEAMIGFVPSFMKAFPPSGVAGAWAEFKSVQLSSNTALPVKTKELIGLAVAAQIPCTYCVYFHTAMARANGATDAEVSEAVAMASITRHWSTVLNGMQIDLASFRQETDQAIARAKAKTTSTQ